MARRLAYQNNLQKRTRFDGLFYDVEPQAALLTAGIPVILFLGCPLAASKTEGVKLSVLHPETQAQWLAAKLRRGMRFAAPGHDCSQRISLDGI